mmetsp:Transcript_14237/g.26869  ORF Transcript_14237/g.26869 Transcript_14237/m.26869 type:complete len:324 (+) Transcript_14237:2856-3827(+)
MGRGAVNISEICWLEAKMNKYLYSPPASWSPQESLLGLANLEMTPVQAVESVVNNVNSLIAILRLPNDASRLRSDLSKLEREQVQLYLSESSKALSRLALDYATSPPVSSFIKSEDDLSPPFENIVSAFDLNRRGLEAGVHIRQTVEIEPPINSENIQIGQVFSCLEEASEAFKDYALRCGFNICKGNSKKDVYQEYACSARGKVRMRKVADSIKRRNRRSIKKLCKCHIILRKKGDTWVITTRKLSHTHDLLPTQEVLKTAKNRYIPEEIRQRALEQYLAGEAPARIQYQLEHELGDRVTWSMKDLYNMLYRYKRQSTELNC